MWKYMIIIFYIFQHRNVIYSVHNFCHVFKCRLHCHNIGLFVWWHYASEALAYNTQNSLLHQRAHAACGYYVMFQRLCTLIGTPRLRNTMWQLDSGGSPVYKLQPERGNRKGKRQSGFAFCDQAVCSPSKSGPAIWINNPRPHHGL